MKKYIIPTGLVFLISLLLVSNLTSCKDSDADSATSSTTTSISGIYSCTSGMPSVEITKAEVGDYICIKGEGFDASSVIMFGMTDSTAAVDTLGAVTTYVSNNRGQIGSNYIIIAVPSSTVGALWVRVTSDAGVTEKFPFYVVDGLPTFSTYGIPISNLSPAGGDSVYLQFSDTLPITASDQLEVAFPDSTISGGYLSGTVLDISRNSEGLITVQVPNGAGVPSSASKQFSNMYVVVHNGYYKSDTIYSPSILYYPEKRGFGFDAYDSSDSDLFYTSTTYSFNNTTMEGVDDNNLSFRYSALCSKSDLITSSTRHSAAISFWLKPFLQNVLDSTKSNTPGESDPYLNKYTVLSNLALCFEINAAGTSREVKSGHTWTSIYNNDTGNLFSYSYVYTRTWPTFNFSDVGDNWVPVVLPFSSITGNLVSIQSILTDSDDYYAIFWYNNKQQGSGTFLTGLNPTPLSFTDYQFLVRNFRLIPYFSQTAQNQN
ncbi:MAG: hypothetical protein H6Q14_2945 [Bacteroidetes bacterium]|nr:hypothetical protein [Bacteroidota bacterium]